MKTELEKHGPESEVSFDTSIKMKSLVGVAVSLKDQNPQSVIELIGDALDIRDYETNVASFWFLDFLALQILQFDNDLDENAKSVLIGWLAGEMQLIQEKKLSHDAFWRCMNDIFDKCLKQREPLLHHWDFIVRNNEFNDLVSVKEEEEAASGEANISGKGMTGSRASTKSQRKMISSRNRSRQSVRSLQKSKTEKLENSNNPKSTSKPEVLDIVKEATYNMYGDIFHYSLIVAAFIEPVFILHYKLPYEVRVPRAIKIFNAEKIINHPRDTRSNDVIDDPIIFNNENILMEQRRFILPLMEANEAYRLSNQYKLSWQRNN